MAGASCTATASTMAHSAHFYTLRRTPSSLFSSSSFSSSSSTRHRLPPREISSSAIALFTSSPASSSSASSSLGILTSYSASPLSTFVSAASFSTSASSSVRLLPPLQSGATLVAAAVLSSPAVDRKLFGWTNFGPLRLLKDSGVGGRSLDEFGRSSWVRKLTVTAKVAETEQKVPSSDNEGSSFGPQVPEFQKRLRIVNIKGGPEEGLERVGENMLVRGWVRTCRLQKTFSFIEVNDGSTLSNLQVVVNSDAAGYDTIESGLISTGASIAVEGELIASQGSKQKVELRAVKVVLIGGSDATTFPVQKKKVSREYLRTIAHMRPRTNTFGAVARIRNALAYATHQFFQEKGFVWIASPIITASDCEGAGEQFCVTTLIPGTTMDPKTKISDIPSTKDGLLDWSKDFFGKPAFLTVSGQLNAETYATSLSDVYTFGPTFRAENSNTSRHLAEFWMIEPELAFSDLKEDMACATAYLKYTVKYVLKNCKEDMEFLDKWIEKGIIARLTDVTEKNFVHITYTDAVDLLKRAKKKFEFPVQWGSDLQSEHERYLTEEAFKGTPVIVTDYPKDIKAFYMRVNDDGRTVAAMDVLVPRVGELIGGSQREERLEVLERRIDEMGLNKESFWWYLDLRRYGTVPHAGFGLGFERLVQFATGIENIRDAIPFPRTPGSAEF